MAKQTLKSLLGSSDEREQVELNLNPVALQPTIRSGGNYRVAVQDTPKTNSALQLADALKQGVGLYGQAVEFAQNKAEQDVNTMTDEEYDKFLTEGLDEESRNIFGYTKAYNQALAQKYHAEEIPKKLQDISTEMFSNYYDYKDADTFEAALNQKMQGVYDEADELLNDNVFGNEANRVLKNVTQNDFIEKERAKFLQELPRRNAELGTEAINRSIEGLDDTILSQGMFGEKLREIYDMQKGNFMTPQAANDALFTSIYTRIQTLAESNSTADNRLAEEMLDQIGDGKSIAGIDRTVGGMDIFATGKRQLALTQLESALENKMDTAYTDAVKAIQPRTAKAEAQVISLLAKGASEKEVRATVNDLITELDSPDGLAKFPNDTERDLLKIELRKMLDNPKYFQNEHARNYWLNSQSAYESSLKMALDNIPDAFTEPTSSMANATRKPVGIGEDFVTAAELKLDELYTGIAIEVQSIEDNNEKYLTFKAREKEIIEEFNSWRDEYFTQPSITKEQETLASKQTLLDEAKAYNPKAAEEYKDNPKALEAIVQDGKSETKTDALNADKDVQGFWFGTRFDNFVKASNTGLLTGEDLFRNFQSITNDFKDKELNLGTALSFENGLDRVIGAQELASQYQVAGISSDTLLSGSVPAREPPISEYGSLHLEPNQMSFIEFFDVSGQTFDEFPIVVDGMIENTIRAVEGYFSPSSQRQLDGIYNGPFKAIADKYFKGDLDKLMQMQRSYLQNYNYIESK